MSGFAAVKNSSRGCACAPKAGKGVTEYEPGGKAAEETRTLYEFVCKQLNS